MQTDTKPTDKAGAFRNESTLKNMTRELITAIEAAKAAGKNARRSFGKLSTAHISLKDRNDFVTVVDKRCEDLAANTIRRRFPDDGIMGEEGTQDGGTSGRKWIIDPLDGTLNFIHSVPVFSVSVAMVDETGDLIVGAIYNPIMKELFTAQRGRGAFFNNHRIHVTKNYRSERLLLATGFPYKFYEHLDPYLALLGDMIKSTAGVRRAGSAALDLAYTACGRFDGFWEYHLNAWDIAAGALLVREAGGIVTDFKGDDGFLKSGNIIATNGKIHSMVLEKVQTHFGLSFE